MSELLEQWSGILAYLGDRGFQDGFENVDYRRSPKLKKRQLNEVNTKLRRFVELWDQHSDQKAEVLEMMREYDAEEEMMHGGKRPERSNRKTRKNRRN
jgi:hypothetical protein